MPKQFKRYNDFSGGMNTAADPRDIGDNEVCDAYNVMFDKPGMIRTQGQLATPECSPDSSTLIPLVSGFKMKAGYGLLTFGTDYLPVDTSATPYYNPGKCMAMMGVYTTSYGWTPQIRVVDSLVNERYINWGSGATPPTPVAYYASGAMRVHDAGFVQPSTWFGYIRQTQFDGITGRENDVNKWASTTTIMDPPTYGIVSAGVADDGGVGGSGTSLPCAKFEDYGIAGTEGYVAVWYDSSTPKARIVTAQSPASPYPLTTVDLADGDSWASNVFFLCPPTGTGFNVDVEPGGSDGSWVESTLEFAETFIYVGGQESVLKTVPGTCSISDNNSVVVSVYVTTPYPDTVIGGRVYYRETGSSIPWKLLVDIDLVQGCRLTTEDQYESWIALDGTGSGAAVSDVYARCTLTAAEPFSETYESLNGFSQDSHTLSIDAKCFCVGSNRSWAAGIKTTNISGDTVYYGDRVMYTPVGKHDTWPPKNFLEMGINDGDEVVAITTFADKLLVFKRNKLYIVNVSGSEAEWFLETQHEHLGVLIPGAMYKTDYGVVWVNRSGCYFYDGSNMVNLLEKQSNGAAYKVIDPLVWSAYITDNAIVGFDPSHRLIIVLRDCTSKYGLNYMYDTTTGAWTKGNRFAVDSGEISNFQPWWDDVVVAHSYVT